MSGDDMPAAGKDHSRKPLDSIRALWKPSDAQFLEGLTLHQRAVLTVLIVHADNSSGACHPSILTIAKGAGVSRSMAIRVLGELVEQGRISRRSQPPAPTSYVVHSMDGPQERPRQSTWWMVTVHSMDTNCR